MALEYDDISAFQNPTQIETNAFEPEGIPTIDLSPLLTPNPKTETLKPLLEEIKKACAEWGFFQIINHGVPLELLERVQHAAKEFFALPLEEKKKVAKTKTCFLGYHNGENTKNIRDWKEIFEYEPKGAIFQVTGEDVSNQWPEFPPNMREVCVKYGKEVEALAFKLLEAIAMSLNLPAKRLNNHFSKDSTSTVLLNHYPPCPLPERILGVNPHTDVGAITVLAQDNVGGLEVKRRIDGKWVRVKPVPNSFIINIGDLFQVWSNDKYESAEHRVVVNTTKDRFSIPFFFCPSKL